ncbi:twin-arginine translocase TatA/TatE family subunit [Deinococcus sp. KSM4-11]|uniref:Sec-independent protein translocase subunit TatA/TatB n=1 Tax=Deinococcus sp. KSM4-11 TaxID=2568654 RepID=UPI0010A44E06|nr:twin-arginine translocase TatA/TatE family subunit [Deinococcus sp. KSM4-11]THF87768.1 twin-arginine translocase TatA/TatE family subunit [Deinococcus sp. KSM4-11]
MPNIGAPELIVILIVALVVFGPRKLPELGKSLGAGLREFRKVTSGVTEEFKTTVAAPSIAPVQAVPATAVTAPTESAPRVS